MLLKNDRLGHDGMASSRRTQAARTLRKRLRGDFAEIVDEALSAVLPKAAAASAAVKEVTAACPDSSPLVDDLGSESTLCCSASSGEDEASERAAAESTASIGSGGLVADEDPCLARVSRLQQPGAALGSLQFGGNASSLAGSLAFRGRRPLGVEADDGYQLASSQVADTGVRASTAGRLQLKTPLSEMRRDLAMLFADMEKTPSACSRSPYLGDSRAGSKEEILRDAEQCNEKLADAVRWVRSYRAPEQKRNTCELEVPVFESQGACCAGRLALPHMARMQRLLARGEHAFELLQLYLACDRQRRGSLRRESGQLRSFLLEAFLQLGQPPPGLQQTEDVLWQLGLDGQGDVLAKDCLRAADALLCASVQLPSNAGKAAAAVNNPPKTDSSESSTVSPRCPPQSKAGSIRWFCAPAA
eukprot:TRINITY_DN47206_c0_g1_i1.p1 TRINITY_DN47206_c0_g1~~TRINITY_DN47206_c0_g1_i1.p1  ORF type:complete len:417 (+),score=115.17 TRINITY_DN47206_c0_g1_i1:70-1320(+)